MNWLEHINAAALQLAKAGIDEPSAEARYLWAYATDTSLVSWFSGGREVSDADVAHFYHLVHRRAQREPFHYIVGQREFMGLTLTTTADALIPRPETELLVQQVLADIQPDIPITVVDVGTGSGAIALSLRHYSPAAVAIYATDISAAALALARANAERLGLSVHFALGSLLEPIEVPVNIVVANLPYISFLDKEYLDPELSYEPEIALYAGRSGTELVEQLIDQAREKLMPGGHIYLEVGQGQSNLVLAYLRNAGFTLDPVVYDYGGIDRIVGGSWRGNDGTAY
jgi:release factor glutamine methyltransferase